jgi:WD40 repeat protein
MDAAAGTVLKKIPRQLLTMPPSNFCPPVWLDDFTVLEVGFPANGVAEKQYATTGRTLVVWRVDQEQPELAVAARDALYLSLSPDRTKIAEAGRDMKVRIRDAKTLKVERTLRVHDGTVTCVEWHPTLPLLATCSEDCSMKIWDVRTGSLVEQFGFFDQAMTRLLWSPDGFELCGVVRHESSVVYRPKALQAGRREASAPETPKGDK